MFSFVMLCDCVVFLSNRIPESIYPIVILYDWLFLLSFITKRTTTSHLKSLKFGRTKTTRYADGNPGSSFGQAQKCDIVNQLMGSEPSPSHNCIYPMTIHISTHTKSAAQVTSIQKDHTLHKSEIQHKRRLCNSRVTSLKPLNHVKCRGYKPYRCMRLITFLSSWMEKFVCIILYLINEIKYF